MCTNIVAANFEVRKVLLDMANQFSDSEFQKQACLAPATKLFEHLQNKCKIHSISKICTAVKTL
jgi:hypothetical protein